VVTDAHRQVMRRLGIKREHIRHQASPAGDVMVLVWEGVEQDRASELMADLVKNPQSEHERYIATHVIPDLHGADPAAGPPPTVQEVAWTRHRNRSLVQVTTSRRGAGS
jgi:hypothetical protein